MTERDYSDIISAPRHRSDVHPAMSLSNRAAQFAPFAALSGFDDDVAETARLTDDKLILEEERLNILNSRMQLLLELISSRPTVEVTYFIPDERKSGGRVITVGGRVRRIDEANRKIIFTNSLAVEFDDVYDIVIK